MSKKKLHAVQIEFITATINRLVAKTGLPVAAQTIERAGIATRQELRKLEKDVVLKSCLVTAGRGIMNAYYTEGVVPDVVRRKQAEGDEHREPGEPSEVHNPEGSEVPA